MNLQPLSSPYDDIVAVSGSDLNLLKTNHKKFLARKIHAWNRRETDYFRFGTAFHCAVLRPAVFAQTYMVLPEEVKAPASPNQVQMAELMKGELGLSAHEAYRRSYKKAFKESDADAVARELAGYVAFLNASQGKTVLSGSDHAMITAMAHAYAAHPFSQAFSAMESVEEVAVHVPANPEAGVPVALKGRLDRVCVTNHRILVFDLKSTSSLDSAFDSTEFGYAEQLSHYAELVSMIQKGVPVELEQEGLEFFSRVDLRDKPIHRIIIWVEKESEYPGVAYQGFPAVDLRPLWYKAAELLESSQTLGFDLDSLRYPKETERAATIHDLLL